MKSIHRKIIKIYDSYKLQESCALYYYKVVK